MIFSGTSFVFVFVFANPCLNNYAIIPKTEHVLVTGLGRS
jgi:hypothetical protein